MLQLSEKQISKLLKAGKGANNSRITLKQLAENTPPFNISIPLKEECHHSKCETL